MLLASAVAPRVPSRQSTVWLPPLKVEVQLVPGSFGAAQHRRGQLIADGADAADLTLHGCLAGYRLPKNTAHRELVATLLAPLPTCLLKQIVLTPFAFHRFCLPAGS
jgi:hypothetical protein